MHASKARQRVCQQATPTANARDGCGDISARPRAVHQRRARIEQRDVVRAQHGAVLLQKLLKHRLRRRVAPLPVHRHRRLQRRRRRRRRRRARAAVALAACGAGPLRRCRVLRKKHVATAALRALQPAVEGVAQRRFAARAGAAEALGGQRGGAARGARLVQVQVAHRQLVAAADGRQRAHAHDAARRRGGEGGGGRAAVVEHGQERKKPRRCIGAVCAVRGAQRAHAVRVAIHHRRQARQRRRVAAQRCGGGGRGAVQQSAARGKHRRVRGRGLQRRHVSARGAHHHRRARLRPARDHGVILRQRKRAHQTQQLAVNAAGGAGGRDRAGQRQQRVMRRALRSKVRGSGKPCEGRTRVSRRTAPLAHAGEQKAEAPTRSGGRSARQWWHAACTKRSRGAKAQARSRSTSSPAPMSRVAMAHRPRLRARARASDSRSEAARRRCGCVPWQRLYGPRQVRFDALEGRQRRAGRGLALLRSRRGRERVSRAQSRAAPRLLLLLARSGGTGRGVGARRLFAVGRLLRLLARARLHLRRSAPGGGASAVRTPRQQARQLPAPPRCVAPAATAFGCVLRGRVCMAWPASTREWR